MSLTHLRVSGPVTGLKRMPSAMPGDEQRRVAPAVRRLPWSRSAAFLRSSTAALQLLADLLVGGDAGGERDRATRADQLGVEILRRRERAHHVVAQLLVVHRAFDVGFDVLRCAVNLVFCLGHARWILSPRYLAPDTPGSPTANRCSFWLCSSSQAAEGRASRRRRSAGRQGHGFSFGAPAGWRVEHVVGRTAASQRLAARPGGDLPARHGATRPRSSPASPASSICA